MLSNRLASSSLPKREVWKCFKSFLHTTSQVFAWNQRNFCEIESLLLSGLFAKFCGSCHGKYCVQKSIKFGGNVAFLCD